jgi:hypothetical protein
VAWTNHQQVQPGSQHSRVESGSSALGAGGPSDWEHFQASVTNLEEEKEPTPEAQDQRQNSRLSTDYAELPAERSRPTSKGESLQQVFPQHSEPRKFDQSSHNDDPIREDSLSLQAAGETLQRSGTIDGVIQAWANPLGSAALHAQSRQSSVSTLDHRRQQDPGSTDGSPKQELRQPKISEEQTKASRSTLHHLVDQRQADDVTPVLDRQNSLAPRPLTARIIEVDPYANLGPEYRASLARYATMLRKEEAAPEGEKYKLFKAFLLKEDRLRRILYGVEESELAFSGISLGPTKSVEPQKAPLVKEPNKTPPTASEVVDASSHVTSASPRGVSPRLTVSTSATNEDSYVVVERDDDSDYSPGGRPRRPKAALKRTVSQSPRQSSPKKASSPSDYAPILIEDLPFSPGITVQAPRSDLPSRPGTAPLAMRPRLADDAIKFEPPRPAYTPFRYAEGPQRGSEPLVVSRPAYQAYSALRHQSVDSGRVMAQSTVSHAMPARRETLASPTGNTARREHEEAFLGLIREKSRAYRPRKEGRPVTPFNRDTVPSPPPVDRPTQAINAIREMVPKTMPDQRKPSPKLAEAKAAMDKYPDVFSFIPETVAKWDRDNKVVRKKQEEERQLRQEDSEKHIDDLFNAHEIGYSDIGHLEAEFKLAEAKRNYDEDLQELESFADGVFKPVTERLKSDLLQLNAQYIRVVDLLEVESDSGLQYLKSEDRASRAEAMEIVLALYNKLQTRHVKMAEAHYERERRRKKLELSVLYTNGDTAAMKKLEQEFTKAERQQALHEAREKDSRANKLMDTFDRASVRGLGDNQQFVDDVNAKLQNLNKLIQEEPEVLPKLIVTDVQDLLRSIEDLLDYVANDSKSVLTVSNTADNMLNSADYDVSVAEAKVANATPESMKILEEEKNKEDERIKAEVDTRMGSVAKGPASALTLLKIVARKLSDDPQHQGRVQKALEAAKLRNASKTPVE